jgi:acyl-CoA reductase-like NAD-dependent aldehyde dehydrogenase
MLINGRLITTNKSFPVINPATEDVIAEAPEADAASVELALASAREAFEPWSRMPLSQRQPIILKYADLLEENRNDIIDLLIAETGKPIDNAEWDRCLLPEIVIVSWL